MTQARTTSFNCRCRYDTAFAALVEPVIRRADQQAQSMGTSRATDDRWRHTGNAHVIGVA